MGSLGKSKGKGAHEYHFVLCPWLARSGPAELVKTSVASIGLVDAAERGVRIPSQDEDSQEEDRQAEGGRGIRCIVASTTGRGVGRKQGWILTDCRHQLDEPCDSQDATQEHGFLPNDPVVPDG